MTDTAQAPTAAPFAGDAPERRGVVLLATITIGAIVCGHTLLETARDVLFLQRLSPARLPGTYLLLAGISAGIALAPHPLAARASARSRLVVALVLAGIVTASFSFLTKAGSEFAYYAMYAWTGVFGTLAVSYFWSAIGNLFTITEAKRAYGTVGFGGVVGGVLGAGLARGTFAVASPRAALPLAGAIFLVAAALSATLGGQRAHEVPVAGKARTPITPRETIRSLGASSYLRTVAAVAFLSPIALTLLDFTFKRSLVEHLPEGASFANTYAWITIAGNVLAAVAQVTLVRWALRHAGVAGVAQVLPALLLVGSAALVMGGGALAVVVASVMRVCDATLRFSLHRTAMELLFVPLSDAVRERVKPLLDVVTQRGGQAVAAGAIVVILSLPMLSDHVTRTVGALIMVSTLAWFGAGQLLRVEYTEVFRATLREGALNLHSGLPGLDVGSLESLVVSLNSEIDGEVVAAMDVLAEQGKAHLIPALILYHPSDSVVARALDHFARARRKDAVRVIERLLTHATSAEVRAAALRTAASIEFDEERIRSFLRDANPELRATALVLLLASGADDAEREARAVAEIVEGGDVSSQVAFLKALQHAPRGRDHTSTLAVLAASPDVNVRLEAIRAMTARPSPTFLPVLIAALGLRQLRHDARRALAALGDVGLRALDDTLRRSDVPERILRHIPRSINHFQPGKAAPLLLRLAATHGDGLIRYKALRGLSRLRDNRPEIALERALVRRIGDEAVVAATDARSWRESLAAVEPSEDARPVHELLLALLIDREWQAIERTFRVLKIFFPAERWERIYSGLRGANPRVRASSFELLEGVLRGPLRKPLRALLDPDPPRTARHVAELPEMRLERTLGEMLTRGGTTVKALAAYYAGAENVLALEPGLAATSERTRASIYGPVVETALARIRDPNARLTKEPAGAISDAG